MTKSEIFINLAAIPDTDPKLQAIAAIISGQAATSSARPASLRLYKMGEAADEMKLSRCTLWRAVKEGHLKAVEIRRGSLRIPESELRRFVEGRVS